MLTDLADCTAMVAEPWFAAEVQTKYEKAIAWKLLERGIPYYLPLVERVKRVAHFRRKLVLPLFPNYIFIAGEDGGRAIEFCQEERGVFGIIRAPNQKQLRRELASLEIALHANPRLEVVDIDAVGQHVRVTGGSLEGTEGYVEGFQEARGMVRVFVRIEMLGKGTVMDIDRSDLEAIN